MLSERKELDGIQNYEEEANEITCSMWTESALLNGLSVILREAAGPSQQDQPLIPPGTVDEGDPGGAFLSLLSGSAQPHSHLPCCLLTPLLALSG